MWGMFGNCTTFRQYCVFELTGKPWMWLSTNVNTGSRAESHCSLRVCYVAPGWLMWTDLKSIYNYVIMALISLLYRTQNVTANSASSCKHYSSTSLYITLYDLHVDNQILHSAIREILQISSGTVHTVCLFLWSAYLTLLQTIESNLPTVPSSQPIISFFKF